MNAILERETMPKGQPKGKAKGRPKTSTRDDITVKIDRRLVGMAKYVANYRGISLAELLTAASEDYVNEAYIEMLRDLEKKKGQK